MDFIAHGRRHRVIGIYWGDNQQTYAVGFNPYNIHMTVVKLGEPGFGEEKIEIVDYVIADKFTYVGDFFHWPGLINSIVFEAGLWDSLLDCDSEAHARLMELMPELRDVGKEHLYHCRVCGFKLDFCIWGRYNESPTFELCPCCGVQFGVMDESLFLAIKAREAWLREGAPWFDPSRKPSGWNLDEQLKHIPEGFE